MDAPLHVGSPYGVRAKKFARQRPRSAAPAASGSATAASVLAQRVATRSSSSAGGRQRPQSASSVGLASSSRRPSLASHSRQQVVGDLSLGNMSRGSRRIVLEKGIGSRVHQPTGFRHPPGTSALTRGFLRSRMGAQSTSVKPAERGGAVSPWAWEEYENAEERASTPASRRAAANKKAREARDAARKVELLASLGPAPEPEAAVVLRPCLGMHGDDSEAADLFSQIDGGCAGAGGGGEQRPDNPWTALPRQLEETLEVSARRNQLRRRQEKQRQVASIRGDAAGGISLSEGESIGLTTSSGGPLSPVANSVSFGGSSSPTTVHHAIRLRVKALGPSLLDKTASSSESVVVVGDSSLSFASTSMVNDEGSNCNDQRNSDDSRALRRRFQRSNDMMPSKATLRAQALGSFADATSTVGIADLRRVEQLFGRYASEGVNAQEESGGGNGGKSTNDTGAFPDNP